MASEDAHIIYLPMGQWPVFVGFTTNAKAFRREVKRLGVKERVGFTARAGADATTHFFDKDGASLCCIIVMPKRGTRSHSQYAALVAHEALHVVQAMHRQLNSGEPFGDEADAYLIQSIVQNCLQEAFDEGLAIATEPKKGGLQ
jgi:hypothetical protein